MSPGKSPVHVALARGLNVGGKNRLAMKELVRAFEDAGAENVSTYIQSGNVLFTASAAAAKMIAERVGELLEERHGLRVPLVVRSATQLEKVAASNLFLRDPPSLDPKSLLVAFLAGRPTAARVASLAPDRSPSDRFAVLGSEVYLWCPNGVARSKLTTAWLDVKLATTATVRSWQTVCRLVELCRD